MSWDVTTRSKVRITRPQRDGLLLSVVSVLMGTRLWPFGRVVIALVGGPAPVTASATPSSGLSIPGAILACVQPPYVGEKLCGVTQKLHGLQYVLGHHRVIRIQLEMALHPGEPHWHASLP